MSDVGSANLDPDVVLGQVNEALSILNAIDEGGLLSDAPAGATARRRHQSGVVLVEILRDRLELVRAGLDAALSVAPSPQARRPAIGSPVGPASGRRMTQPAMAKARVVVLGGK